MFGDRDSGAYLLKFAWTKITRHTLVKGWASPDDPALTSYWAARRRRGTPPLDPPRLRLLQRQRGRCPLCGQLLLHADQEPQHPDEWEQWITAVRTATRHQAITVDARPGHARRTRRVQPHPHPLPTPPPRRHQQWTSTSADLTHARLQGLLEPVARKRAWPVLRGRRRGNAPPLPDWKGPFYLLEAAGLTVQLVNPAHARQLAGRPKTDRLDAQWIARLAEMGLLRPSFVPPPEIRALRDLTRTRLQLVRDRTREWQRLEKLLEGALIKLSSVVSRWPGPRPPATSWRPSPPAQRDPKALAALAAGAGQGRRAAVEQALDGMRSASTTPC